MKLYDIEHHHEVASINGDQIVSRRNRAFKIDGYAVVDDDDELVGTLIDGKFFNSAGTLMATTEAQSA
jgi:hypothetical protein